MKPNPTYSLIGCLIGLSFPWLALASALVLNGTLPATAGPEGPDAQPAHQTQPPIALGEIGAKATADYRGDALGITASPEGARLGCEFQKLEARATRDGLWLTSTEEAGGRLRLVATRLGRGEGSTLNPQATILLPATGSVVVGDEVVRFTRAALTEEYSVSVDGVRQDFVVGERPGAGGDLWVVLALTGARAEAAACGAKLTFDVSRRELAYSRVRAVDATGKLLTARLEVLAPARLAVCVEDDAAVYPVRIDPTFSDADWVSLNPDMPGANTYVRAVALDGSGGVYVGGMFTFIGTVAANYVAKWNGSVWSALGSGMNDWVETLAVSGADLYAGGRFTTAGGVTANRIAKWDGSTWSALGSGVDNGVWALAVSGPDLYAGGYFSTAGGVPANCIAKWNGSAWSALGSGMNRRVRSLAVSGSVLYAGGEFTEADGTSARYVARWNGSAWLALGSGMNDWVEALGVSGTDLYAAGSFTLAGGVSAHHIAKWNGSDWSTLGSGMNTTVSALAIRGSVLYAGGVFTMAGEATANYVAEWDGSAWSALGTGMNQGVVTLLLSGADLYAGGAFTAAGGVCASYIAKWDGSTWSAVGSGMNRYGYVNALAASGTDLYAGGSFTTAGGVAANYVAKWNGSAWSPLGSGMNGPVRSLAVSGSVLYAGGEFTEAGGAPAWYVARWDGSAWSPLGVGSSGIIGYAVRSLAVSGSVLYAGGDFAFAGGSLAKNVAKWDGSAWSPLASGMDYPVFALAVSGTDVYAGGSFTKAGGVPVNYIAKWDGSAWAGLGAGMNSGVGTLVVSGSHIYAGGDFTTAGGVPANRIARWDGSVWSGLGSGTDSTVFAMATDTLGHLFVGGGFLSAGTTVSPFIVQANIAADYIVTTTSEAIVVTDSFGHGDTLTLSEPATGQIQFAAAGRSFSVNDGALRYDDSGNFPLSGIGSAIVNAGGGDDTINVGPFTSPLPELTLNGGAGADTASVLGGSTVTINDADGFTLNGSRVSTLLTVNSDGPVGQTAASEGTGGLKKLGIGTLTLSQNNAYTGTTTVAAGTLALTHASHNNVAGSLNLIVQSGAVLDGTALAGGRLDLASGQTLRGSGTVIGTVGVSAGATLAPGASTGILNCGSVVFSSGSTFAVEIEGPAVGTGYDQLNVTGTVELGGATLALSATYTPVVGDTFVILDNDGPNAVAGTFKGLAEGATIALNGETLKISYVGGDGNDVTLRRETPPTAATLAYFQAIAVGRDEVRLNWGTLVEVWTLGFRVDRSTPAGDWQRVTAELMPALGVDQRPHAYSLVDSALPAMNALTYRLVEVQLTGAEVVVAEAAVKPVVAARLSRRGAALTLEFLGQAGTAVALQTAAAVTGPWTPLDMVELDEDGAATVYLYIGRSEPARFYRWEQE